MSYVEMLLDRIDFEHPALSAAKEKKEQGDSAGALTEIIRHFRTRTSPAYLFEKEDIEKFTDPLVWEEAQKTLDHDIFGHKFDGPIDWMFNPTEHTSHDNEWSWSLFRTIFWQPLARAYAQGGDEKYAREFVDQLKSFAQAWPVAPFLADDTFETKFKFPGHAWRTIESGIRIYTTWLPCYVAFRSSPSWDEEGWAVFLSLIFDHAEYLMGHYSNHNRSSNWLSMEATALFQCGLMFPELKNSSTWFQAGFQRITHEVDYCFDHDGIHMERTPIYHMVAVISFFQSLRLCSLNNIPVPPYGMTIIERATEYLMYLIKPDFSTPMIGDADRTDLTTSRSDASLFEGMNLSFDPYDLNELRAHFRTMAELTGRQDFLYFATQRSQGTAPSIRNKAFLNAGIYVMRTGWEKDDSYYLLHGVELERGERSTHSHNDQGHFELHIKGEDILIDSGRYIYNSSSWKDWRHYFLSAKAHNTLYVDDHEMGTVPGISRVRGVRTVCHRFEENPDFSIIDVSHNGYAFRDRPIFHRRKAIRLSGDIYVVDDMVSGLSNGTHDMRFYYNFAPGKLHETAPGTFTYETDKGSIFTVSTLSSSAIRSEILYGSLEPLGGWVSYSYSKREPIPQLVLHVGDILPLRFVTVIAPQGTDCHARFGKDREHVEIAIGGKKMRAVCLQGDTVEITKEGKK